MKCRQCNKELPKYITTDICLECSRNNVKNIFGQYPEVKEVFMNCIEDMKKELK